MPEADHITSKRKIEALKLWKSSRKRGVKPVLLPGVTGREMRQWEAIEKKHGIAGLMHKTSLLPFRDAPRADLLSSRERDIINPHLELCIEGYSDLGPGERWFLTIVHEFTVCHRICTIADLVHHLWDPRIKKLPGPKILHVLSNKINKKIGPDNRLESVWGRGYTFIPTAPAVEAAQIAA